MRRLLALLMAVTAIAACGATSAGADPRGIGLEIGEQQGVLTIAPEGRQLGVVIDHVAGPCAIPTRETEDYSSAKHVLQDPAGCLTFDRRDRDPGPGCAIVDEAGTALAACGLSGVQRVEVRGGAGDDTVTFATNYAFGGATLADLGAGDDQVEARDGAVEEIARGPGEPDTPMEDIRDVRRDGEEGNGLAAAPADARNGRIERRDGRLVADFSAARGNTLGRLPYDVTGRGDEHAVRFGLADQALPHLGDGCYLRRGEPYCLLDGLSGLDILGPASARDRFEIDTSFAVGTVPGPVTVHAGPSEAILHVQDGIAE